jgi:aldehyde:ferredoxin oxidoreductase
MDELFEAGERRLHMLRAFNAREGIGKNADVLPKKLFQPLGGSGPTAGVAITADEFEHARQTYYRLGGFDPETGYPTREKLTALGLGWLVERDRGGHA